MIAISVRDALMGKYINWRRLAVGTLMVTALLAPLYLFALRGDSGSVRAAAFRDTPGAEERTGVAEGKLAPDFEISTPAGDRVRLSELRGRPVLVNFWATWCGSCLSEMPAIEELQAERGASQFVVLAINAGETPRKAQEFIDFLEAPFVYGLDVDMTVTDGYGVYGLPLSVFIDAEGVVRAVYRGHADRNLLARFIDAAVDARPPGDIPTILRIVTRIPRERVLIVTGTDESVVIRSRTLRCDPSYCAEDVIKALRDVPGVLGVDEGGRGAEVGLRVRLSKGVLGKARIVETLSRLLEAYPDPLYEGAILVRYQDGS
jgi:thiol-disulfide isomerase/thioredoxin